MVLKTSHFVCVLCAALVLGLTLTHGLEIPDIGNARPARPVPCGLA
jgi:hypothetical protein